MSNRTHTVLAIGQSGTRVIVRDDNTEEELYSFAFKPSDITIEVDPSDVIHEDSNKRWVTLDTLLGEGGYIV